VRRDPSIASHHRSALPAAQDVKADLAAAVVVEGVHDAPPGVGDARLLDEQPWVEAAQAMASGGGGPVSSSIIDSP